MLVRALMSLQSRPREADTVKIPAIPSAAGFLAWRSTVRDEVVAASGKAELAWTWILQTEATASTWESLQSPGPGFATLDAKLASALMRAASGDLAMELAARKEQSARAGLRASGRQLLWLVYRFFRTSERSGGRYTLADLLKVRYTNDANLRQFYLAWRNVMTNIDVRPDDTQLEDMLFEQVRSSPGFGWVVGYYNSLPVGHPDKSYD